MIKVSREEVIEELKDAGLYEDHEDYYEILIDAIIGEEEMDISTWKNVAQYVVTTVSAINRIYYEKQANDKGGVMN